MKNKIASIVRKIISPTVRSAQVFVDGRIPWPSAGGQGQSAEDPPQLENTPLGGVTHDPRHLSEENLAQLPTFPKICLSLLQLNAILNIALNFSW
jgi:hypothetical protein